MRCQTGGLWQRGIFSASGYQSASSGSGAWTAAQDDPAQIRVNVNLVQLNVAVTDSKGNYVTGLRPQDFTITEDRIPEKIATFEEGMNPPAIVADANPSSRRNRGGEYRPGSGQRVRRSAAPAVSVPVLRCQRLHSLRHQQLHVPGICLRPGCHRRFRAFPAKRQQGSLLFLQPRSFPGRAADHRSQRRFCKVCETLSQETMPRSTIACC